jgi:hypothetical protein
MGISLSSRTNRVYDLVDASTDGVVGTAYLMLDGWHVKHANRHDRYAWVGPFADLDDVIDRFETISATAPVPGIVR